MNIHEEYWRAEHERRYAVSEDPVSSSTQALEMAELDVPSGKVFLDIGVGCGAMARLMLDAGNTVHCLDITEAARAKVPEDASFSLDVQTVGPVDLAVAHTVFQHCPAEEVLWLLGNVELNDDGVLAFQTMWMPSGTDAHNFSRTDERYEAMIEETGRELLRKIRVRWDLPGRVCRVPPGVPFHWTYFHVR